MSSQAETWVLRVLMNKAAFTQGRNVETYQLYLDGRIVDLKDDDLEDTVKLVVSSAQEINEEDPSRSVRIFTFNSLQTLAGRSGHRFITVITFDLVTEVAFEYTWIKDDLERVDASLVGQECDQKDLSLIPTPDNLTWSP